MSTQCQTPFHLGAPFSSRGYSTRATGRGTRCAAQPVMETVASSLTAAQQASLILEFLGGSLEVDSLNKEKAETLLSEALYYDLPRLVSKLHGGYVPACRTTSSFDRSMAHRTALAEGQEGAAAAADAALIDVFGPHSTQNLRFDPEAAANFIHLPNVPILFNADAVSSRRSPQPVGCLSLADFQTRLDVFAGPLFAGLDMTNLVVAGGAVLHALLLDNTVGDDTTAIRARAKAARGSSDDDIFVVAEERPPPRRLR